MGGHFPIDIEVSRGVEIGIEIDPLLIWGFVGSGLRVGARLRACTSQEHGACIVNLV